MVCKIHRCEQRKAMQKIPVKSIAVVFKILKDLFADSWADVNESIKNTFRTYTYISYWQ